MTNTIDLLPLHPHLNTKKDANDLLLKFESISQKLFKKNSKPSEIIANEFPYELNKIILKMANDLGVNIEDKLAIQSFFKRIIEAISGLSVINLTLAIEPDLETIKLINQWFYLNIGKMVLLDITLDTSLIGGAIVSFNGRTIDSSLITQIAQINSKP